MLVCATVYYKPEICSIVTPKSCTVEPEACVSATLTTYWALENQCDSMPLVTATGFTIDTNSTANYVAVSRDLEKLFPMNSYIQIEGAGDFDGVYKVVDRTHYRLKNTIDVFSKKVTKLHNVKVSKHERAKTD